jgi:prevent-host-death family protein
MRRSVGVRELKANPGRYLRQVQEENIEFDVTMRGDPVARLVPVKRRMTDEEVDEFWRQHHELAERISASLPPGEVVDAVEMVREQRRDL